MPTRRPVAVAAVIAILATGAMGGAGCGPRPVPASAGSPAPADGRPSVPAKARRDGDGDRPDGGPRNAGPATTATGRDDGGNPGDRREPATATSTPAATEPAGLAWVNPARCLAPCARDPGPTLRRVNDQGAPDPRGKLRVDATVVEPLSDLLAAARAAGHALRINSAFRSYQEQARLFRTTKERGRAARPGHSEHQLGTAIDLRLPTSAAIAWLAGHAHQHGFALSYPAGGQRLTGYRPEPWHVRFVGSDTAAELHRAGWTLEELFRAHPERGESGTCHDCPAAVSRAPCGAVTPQGACEGTVLTWCYDGALAAVDCAVSSQMCGPAGNDRTPICLPTAGSAAAVSPASADPSP